MADVSIDGDRLKIRLSLLDRLLAFHGSFDIPLAHVTNAYVSTFEELELQFRLAGTNLGFLKAAGVFANPQGLIFCDITGHGDCLVVETSGERYPRIAVELPSSSDPDAVAHEIIKHIPRQRPGRLMGELEDSDDSERSCKPYEPAE